MRLMRKHDLNKNKKGNTVVEKTDLGNTVPGFSFRMIRFVEIQFGKFNLGKYVWENTVSGNKVLGNTISGKKVLGNTVLGNMLLSKVHVKPSLRMPLLV